MRQEKSCGAAIYIARERETLWLVERMRQGHTSLCKGHVEAGETEHDTAVREIREETALAVEFQDGFRERIEYSPGPGVTKEVIFFLARARGADTSAQPEEVSSIEWLPFDDALAASPTRTINAFSPPPGRFWTAGVWAGIWSRRRVRRSLSGHCCPASWAGTRVPFRRSSSATTARAF